MSTSSTKVRAILVGSSGYTGLEVIRLMLRHGTAEIVGVFGREEKEQAPVESFFPQLSKQFTLSALPFDIEKVAALKPDVALLCVPHKVAMSYVPQLRSKGIRVIDLSADYRISDPAVYEKWYSPHTDLPNLAQAVYGLPEFFADKIHSAGLVANPGCYPTCTALPLAPVLSAGLIEPAGILVNAISGVSGAGRSPALKYHYPERNENFEPYGVGNHRHMPEMEQTLSAITGGAVELLFQPHLCAMDRGMLCTIYARPRGPVTTEQVLDVLSRAYADKPFVRVRSDVLPAVKYVNYTNYCDITARVAKGWVILFSAIDNLLKGASGQAVQNLNLMFGLDETTGLY